MKKLYIAFLWHMHQPLYKDYLTNRYYLPWVRLHSLKGYYDMPALIKEFPEVKVTFNLTPSLVFQLQDYITNDSIHDDFLTLSKKPAEDLTREDKGFILSHFFMNNWETVIKTHPRYGELLRMRGLHYTAQNASRLIERFDRQDFLDLQVLFNISWFGYAFKKKKPQLAQLMNKERDYTEDDKTQVLDFQVEAMREIIPLYKQLQDEGHIEITTSPYYHPILPLLNSGVSQYGFSWEEDVCYHIDKAIALYEYTFGRKPRGFWPSEGSVSRSILYPFVHRGITWLATDEEILINTLGGGNRAELIYKPYFITSGPGKLDCIFRDKKLSDLIGFSYANSDPDHAVHNFVAHLHAIHKSVVGLPGEHLVSVILDGENAWEFYRDGGERFLSLLYKKITDDPLLEAVTVSDYLGRFPPQDELHNLYAGSWINHSFDIWYGHHEDKIAWEYLDKARSFLNNLSLAPDKAKQTWEEIYAAEGSDWFWWFGDEFSSMSDATFDFLFRTHLMNIYRITNHDMPEYLNIPIKSRAPIKIKQEPLAFIYPTIDGTVTTFYEWAYAGLYTVDDIMGAMQTSIRSIDAIYYGFNLETLFFRIDINRNVSLHRLEGCRGCIELITARHKYHLTFPLRKDASSDLYRIEKKEAVPILSFDGCISFDKIIELSCPFSCLGVAPHDEIQFAFSLMQDDIPVEKWPKFGSITFAVPDVHFEETVWSV